MSDLSKLLTELNSKKMDPVKREKMRLDLLRAQGPRKDMTTLTFRDVQHDLNADMWGGVRLNLISPLDGDALVYDSETGKITNSTIDPTTEIGDMLYRFDTPETNFAAYAQGARAYSSGAHPSYPADNAIDGNNATAWSSNGMTPGPWIYIDLQTPRSIGRYAILQNSVLAYNSSFKIQSSDDAVIWTDVHTSYSEAEVQSGSFTSVTARYFQFLSTGGGYGNGWTIFTIELYPASGASTPLSRLPIGVEGTVLKSVGSLPTWSTTATPEAHKTTHENGGSDEISVAGLSGVLADAQTPAAHNQAATTIDVTDTADYFTGAEVEAILAEIGVGWAKLARKNTFTAGQIIQSTDEPYTDLGLDIHNSGGVELITAQVDRDFSGAGNWSGTNWAISSAKYLHTAGSTVNATLANANLTAGSIMAGRYYALTFTISGMSAGTLIPKLGTGSGGSYSADGTYTTWFIASADDVDLILTPSSTFNGSIDDISLTLVAAQLVFVNNGHLMLGGTAPDADAWMHVKVYDTGTTKLKFENKGKATGSAAAVECKVDNGARVLLVHGGSFVTATSFAAFANRGGLITDATNGLGIGIAARQAAGNIIFYAGGVASTNEKLKIDVTEVVVNDLGDSTVDLRAESDTESNMLFLDSSADILYLGGTTDSAKVAKGGVITYNGTAKRHLSLRPQLYAGRVGDVAKPTFVAYGANAGYSFPIFSSDDEELFFRESLPGRWDGASDIVGYLVCALAGAEDVNDDFAFQLSWANKATDAGVISSATTDVTVPQNVETGRAAAYSIYKLAFTIDWDGPATDAAAGDYFGGRIRRVASGGTEVAGEIILLDFYMNYVVDKIFKA